MPKGPQGEKRPRDVVSNAVKVMRIATGEEEEEFDCDTDKNPHAVALGQLGGKKGGVSRAMKLTAEERSQLARKAATARWSREDKD